MQKIKITNRMTGRVLASMAC